jgi:hypothetical protein
MTYQELLNKTASTCCHTVDLIDKSGNKVLGLYNGLASWGQIWGFCNGKDAYGGLFEIAQFTGEWVEDESEEEGGYIPNWTESDFVALGYQVA